MQLKYLCTFWGSETLNATDFLNKVLEEDYDGVEINFPDDPVFIEAFLKRIEEIRSTSHPDFVFIAQQVLDPQQETVAQYQERLLKRLEFLIGLQPDAINSHTGKDFFDFSSNLAILQATENLAKESGIPIWHEIHRGRFSFHLKTLLSYLEALPELKLIADFSHFCVVSESTLQDQQDLLSQIYPHIVHIHARVGSAQAAQVTHPFAPEWNTHLNTYFAWWQEIIDLQSKTKKSFFTITPEFGPVPYMPCAPFTLEPTADQQQINLEMKAYLQANLKPHAFN
ncbi:MAG: hypothetical protein RIT34_123 [Bacteroidota bacterium]|jgi:hypothetical protein